MRKLSKLILTALLALPCATLAQGSLRIQEVRVRGLVCSFCAQGLMKRAAKNSKVKKAEVSLEDNSLKLWVNGTDELSKSEISTIVREAGFSIPDEETKQ
jgi:mercuric ion binding protein